MFTIALIGVDGAGKTTIAKKLLEFFPLPMKYLYMGIHVPSSNITLPTSRLAYFLKLYSYKRSVKYSKTPQSPSSAVHHPEYRSAKRGVIGATARLLNRLAEEYFRQIISWIYQLQGYIVLYDRHFLFEFALKTNNGKDKSPLDIRLHRWFLNHLYPQPNLVIFLDAPPSVLFNRKQEGTLDYLQKWREKYLEQGKTVANFIRVDATQPLDKVLADVTQHIMQFHSSRTLEKVHRDI